MGLLFSTIPAATRPGSPVARSISEICSAGQPQALRQGLVKDARAHTQNQIEAGRKERAHDEAAGHGELGLIQICQECCD